MYLDIYNRLIQFVQNGTEQRFSDIKYEYITKDADNITILTQMAYCRYQYKIPKEIYKDIFKNIIVFNDKIINIIIHYIDPSYRYQSFVTVILPQFINSINLSLNLQNNYVLYDYKQLYNRDKYPSFNDLFSKFQIQRYVFVNSTKYNTIDKINKKLKDRDIKFVVPLDRPPHYAEDAEYDTYMVLITSKGYVKITRGIVNNIEYLKKLICNPIIISDIFSFEYQR
jgi:hypothetical protein